MERRTPLKRTPMKRGEPKPKPQRTPIRPISKTKKRRREQAAGMSMAECRPIIFKRSGERCEHCGRSVTYEGFEAHHRQFRSRGGRDEVVNLVVLCQPCHLWAHGTPRQAIPRGFAVLATEDPALVPIHIPNGLPVWLTTEGTYTRRTPEVP